MMKHGLRMCVLGVAATLAVSCASAKRPVAQPSLANSVPASSFWVRPADLGARDLFYGPWGSTNAPDPADVYRVVERKHSGVNPGLTVVDSKGREWSVKQNYPGGFDAEGPVEVVVSRLLSAVGYHQPAVYYLPAFTLADDFGRETAIGGRFRLKDPSLKEADAWKWEENPFVGTRPYQGLLVMLMMFNSTDLKNSNNSIYERKRGDRVEPLYVVRDIGAALGDTDRFAPIKGNPDAFSKGSFLRGVSNGHVEFAYNGWYKNLVRDTIPPDAVAWASDLLGRLSDRQWRDAFRAGGFEPGAADRFIATMRQKIAEGRSTGLRAAAEP